MSKNVFFATKKIDPTYFMSLDFILIPTCICIVIFLLNRENMILKKNQKVK